jgi:hypothetical protein
MPSIPALISAWNAPIIAVASPVVGEPPLRRIISGKRSAPRAKSPAGGYLIGYQCSIHNIGTERADLRLFEVNLA